MAIEKKTILPSGRATSALSELSSLQKTLNSALDAFKAELILQNLEGMTSNAAKPHPLDDSSYLPSPILYESRKVILAATGLIKLLVQSPVDAVVQNSYKPFEHAALRLASDLALPDILGDSEDGLSIDEIAEKTDVDGSKLERILRLLITEGWFREPKPSYFANSRFSSSIKKDETGHVFVNYMNDFLGKVASKLPDMVNHPDPAIRKNNDPFHAAFQLGFDTDLSFFGDDGWLAQHPYDLENFGRLMTAFSPLTDPGVAADIPWESLALGKDAIVDVGAGRGTLCCSLALRYPEIPKFVVQDLPNSQGMAESFIESNGLKDRVEFESQDFFMPQKRKGKFLYVIQRVLHDWNDEDAGKILKNIKEVMDPQSSLLIIENVVGSSVKSSKGEDIASSLANLKQGDSYSPISPPPYIPADFGEASKTEHAVNVSLIAICNAYERTLPELQKLVDVGEMKIKKIYATRGMGTVLDIVRA